TIYTAASGTVADGSGNSNYSRNLNCKFLIQPAGANFIKLNLTELNTEKDFDILRVYDGSTEFAPLLGVSSGNTLPTEITTSGGAVLLLLITDDVIEKTGWSLDYSINYSGPLSCNGATLFQQTAGTIEDG